mmetsp:Transcript_55751/g.155398  ORF Transcript_55751/g.155398 Transcript_55751/m.155398 type:complete len:222 (+) Transcript_55751:842-1507(+)
MSPRHRHGARAGRLLVACVAAEFHGGNCWADRPRGDWRRRCKPRSRLRGPTAPRLAVGPWRRRCDRWRRVRHPRGAPVPGGARGNRAIAPRCGPLRVRHLALRFHARAEHHRCGVEERGSTRLALGEWERSHRCALGACQAGRRPHCASARDPPATPRLAPSHLGLALRRASGGLGIKRWQRGGQFVQRAPFAERVCKVRRGRRGDLVRTLPGRHAGGGRG